MDELIMKAAQYMTGGRIDNEVLYGKIGYLGHLVHVSEIEGQQ